MIEGASSACVNGNYRYTTQIPSAVGNFPVVSPRLSRLIEHLAHSTQKVVAKTSGGSEGSMTSRTFVPAERVGQYIRYLSDEDVRAMAGELYGLAVRALETHNFVALAQALDDWAATAEFAAHPHYAKIIDESLERIRTQGAVPWPSSGREGRR